MGGETLLTHYWQNFLSELSCILSHLYLIFPLFLRCHFVKEYKKSLKILCTSPPLGYDFNLLFINSLDTDPKWVRRSVIERKFKDQDGMPRDAPGDIDRPGTQFALACDIEIFPNMNNVVHLAFMTIYPKAPGGKEARNKAEGAEVTSWGY